MIISTIYSDRQWDNNSNKIVAIKHLLLNSEKYFKKKFETIIDLDVTSPLRKISDIINAYKKFKKSKLTNAERIIKEIISLPINDKITNEEVKYVIRVVNNFYK